MAKQKFKVAGPFPAYDTKPGGIVELDADDPLVQVNIDAGVIVAGKDATAESKPAEMRCPACTDEGKARPPKFTNGDDLAAHYSEKHPALVAPTFTAEKE